MNCVDCGIPLLEHVHEQMRIDVCPDCHGIFIDHTSLTNVLRDQDAPRPDEEKEHATQVASMPVDQEQLNAELRKCPVCARILRRYVFGMSSGIVVDGCLEHGVWLDAGELQQLEAWVEATDFGMSQNGEKRAVMAASAVQEESVDHSLDEAPSSDSGAIVCSRTISTDKTPAQLWVLLGNPENYPEWMSDLETARIVSPAGTIREQELIFNDAMKVKQRVTMLIPERFISWRDIETYQHGLLVNDLPYSGSWTSISIDPQIDNTVTVTYTLTLMPKDDDQRIKLLDDIVQHGNRIEQSLATLQQ